MAEFPKTLTVRKTASLSLLVASTLLPASIFKHNILCLFELESAVKTRTGSSTAIKLTAVKINE